jgi:hypothetical protein
MTKYFLALLLFFNFNAKSQNTLSDQAQASVLTCGSGNQLYSIFGHTAIRIYDPLQNIDLVYNYGTFDFNTPNFYLKFVKGDLMYQLSVSSFNDFMYEYQYTNRDVWQQRMNISTKDVQKLYQILNDEYFSEEKKYIYKFIYKNCTSKTNDKINEILSAKIIHKIDDKTISYRQVLNPFFKENYWAKLGINAIFGIKVDAAATQLFLPIELLNSLEKAKLNTKNVVFEKEILNKAIPQENKIPWWNSHWIVIILLSILVFLCNKKIIVTSLFIFGIFGVFFASVGLFSLHKEVLWNYNVILFNPIYLLLIYFYAKNNYQKVKFLIHLIFGLFFIYTLYLIYIKNLMIFLPFIIYFIIILLKLKKLILKS